MLSYRLPLEKDSRPKAKRVFPIFRWLRCDNCYHEFRWQFGWKHREDMSYFCYRGYLCRFCAPTRDEARTLARVLQK